MDTGLIVTRIYEPLIIKSIQAQMLDEISEDGYNIEQYTPDVEREAWIIVHDCSEIRALYNFHAVNSSTLMIHSHVLKKFRKDSLRLGQEALKWFSGTGYHKLVVEVPEIHRHIRIYLLKLGFTFEGKNRESYLKHGKYLDQYRYGITRSEICRNL